MTFRHKAKYWIKRKLRISCYALVVATFSTFLVGHTLKLIASYFGYAISTTETITIQFTFNFIGLLFYYNKKGRLI